MTVKKSVAITANKIVLIINKISLFFIYLVDILKIAAILDSNILIICPHVFVCVPVQHKLYTLYFKLFFHDHN